MGKKSSPPPPPDYTATAEKTAASQKAAADAQTLANRPNQVNAAGDTSTWTTGPDGRPVQTTALGAQGQAQQGVQNTLANNAGQQAIDALGKPLDFSGATKIGDYDMGALQGVDAEKLRSGAGQFNMDPTGNSQAIQDATYGLLAPQRKMASDSEIQRLKSQGLTEDSAAFQRAMLRQNQADTDAQLKSLLAGQQEYGNQFQRGLAANNQNFGQQTQAEQFAAGLRGQQFGEQTSQIGLQGTKRQQDIQEMLTQRQVPMNELQQTLQMQQGQQNPQFGSFMGATNEGYTDYSGAAKQQYDAEVAQANAKAKAKGGMMSGLGTLAGGAAGFFFGGPAGAALGAKLGGAAGGMIGGGG